MTAPVPPTTPGAPTRPLRVVACQLDLVVGDLDGKAGMAALVVESDFDIEAFGQYLDEQLPSYARPLFVRLQRQIETTGTFKYRKIDLVNDGFDPAMTKDPLYFRDPAKGYVKITKALRARIENGAFKL